jgi:hypothetical protein
MFHRAAVGEARPSVSPNRNGRSAVLGFAATIVASCLGAAIVQGISFAQEHGVAAASPEEDRALDNAATAVWANTGEDKVTQDEIRSKTANGMVVNSAWDGRNVRIFGARNEVVAFNLILEAGSDKPASGLSVEFNRLTGPDDFSIGSEPVPSPGGIFDWTGRDIELFYVRYLKIHGLSVMSYET